MKRTSSYSLLFCVILWSFSAAAQKTKGYLFDKPGSWKYEMLLNQINWSELSGQIMK